MGYIGKVPADVLIDPMVDSAAITDATIVTADLANDAVTSAKLAADSVDSSELIDGSVDNAHLAGSIAMNKTNLTAGTGLTLSTDTLNVDAAQTQITSVGTLSSLNTSGNIGLGVTPDTWHSSYDALQGANFSLSTDASAGASKSVTLAYNQYIDSGNAWTYINADEASYYQQYNGAHYFATAGAGSADGDVTNSTKLTIANDGTATFAGKVYTGAMLGVNTTTPGTVNGNDHTAGSTGGLVHLKGNLPRILFDDDGDTPQWAVDAQDYFGVWKCEDDSTTETRLFKIDSTGNVNISSSSNVYLSLDTTQANGDEWQIFNAVSGTTSGLQFKNIDTSKLVMLMQEDGKVGIGTASPQRLFHIHSGGSGDTSYMQFTQDGTGATSGDGLLIGINANEQAIIYNQENTDLMLYTNQVERMRLDTSGKVGIGENSPDQLLHVTASSGDPYIVCETASGGGAGIKLVGTDTNNKIQSSGGIDFYTGSSTTANGNLKVSIESGGRIRCTDGIYDDTGTNELVLHANVSGGVGGLYTAQSIALGIWTSNAQRMHITSGGKVGIGTNDPDAHLSVVAAGTDGAGLGRFESTASSGTPEGINVYYPSVAPDNDGWSFLHQDSGATRFIVRNDGDVENHDNDYGATSDERIKDNITDAKSQWDDIKALKVRNFQRKDDIDQYGEDKAMVQIGVIAQEVELISSGLIEEKRPSDYEKDVLKIDGDVKVMKYSVLYMKAIKCLQEAMERIEALENA